MVKMRKKSDYFYHYIVTKPTNGNGISRLTVTFKMDEWDATIMEEKMSS